jgi:hypothetical protein
VCVPELSKTGTIMEARLNLISTPSVLALD